MVLASYDLRELTVRIRNEFSISDQDTSSDEEIRDKINEAIHEIVMRRINWTWLLKPFALDVPASRTVSMQVTQGDRKVSAVTGVLEARDVVSVGNASTEYMLVDSETLNRQWLGDSGVVDVTVGTGFLELPEDFNHMDLTRKVQDLRYGYSFTYMNHTRFEEQKQCSLSQASERVYTYRPDPIEETETMWIEVFPMLTAIDVLAGQYYRDPPDLVDDDDVPLVPRTDRSVVLEFAKYLYARSKGDSRYPSYQANAEAKLRAMMDRYSRTDEEPSRTPGMRNYWEQPFIDVDEDPIPTDYVAP